MGYSGAAAVFTIRLDTKEREYSKRYFIIAEKKAESRMKAQSLSTNGQVQ